MAEKRLSWTAHELPPPASPAHGKPMLLRSFGSEEAQPAVSRGRPGPLGADHVCTTFLDAEVRDVAECVVKAVGEIGGADHQCQFHNLPLIVEFSQLFERTAANRSRAARDALGVQNRGFLLLVKQRAAIVELQRLDLLACDSDSLRRSGVSAGSILAAVD
jgi:hypothetical protein